MIWLSFMLSLTAVLCVNFHEDSLQKGASSINDFEDILQYQDIHVMFLPLIYSIPKCLIATYEETFSNAVSSNKEQSGPRSD